MTDILNSINYISTEELYLILEGLPVPVILTEKDQTIRFANQEALKLGNYKSLNGKKCTDTICQKENCTCPVNGNSIFQNTEQTYYTNDGTPIPVIKKSHPVKFNDDFFYILFISDLSKQQEKEEKLKSIIFEKTVAEEKAKIELNKFEFLFENVNDALYLHDLQGNIKKVNQVVCEQLGYSQEELERMNISVVSSVYPEYKASHILHKLKTNKKHFFESISICKDGTKLPVEVSAKLIEFEDEELILSSVRDVSIRKQYEQQLILAKKQTEFNEAELKTIFNKVPSIIFIFDENSRIQRINERGKEWFNLVNGNYKNLPVGEVINCIHTKNKSFKCGSTKNCSHCELSKAVTDIIKFKKETNKKEIPIQLIKNGNVSNNTVLLSTAVLKSNGNSLFIATLDDITDRKKIETELVHAKEKAEISEKLKTAFLNNISHEIRTPLNGLLGFLDFFEDDMESVPISERRKFVEIMRKSGDRLVRTVTDIIEASKLDSGIMDINKEKFNLGEALELLTGSKLKKYPHHKIDFIFQIDPLLKRQYINTDKSKLLRVLRYLLDNAFKFTLSGTVTLEVERKNNELFIAVQDTGIGISAEDMEVIFNPFRQADISISRAFDGNGLGLTIAHKLVKFMGGELQVESEKGKGSRFYFSLPNIFTEDATLIEKPNSQQLPDTPVKGKTILIAEDDEINYLFLQAVLEKQGYQLIHAVNGKEAVEQVEKNNHLDLIIMDLKMPVMNGIDATIQIKNINTTVPIIAHSAYVLNNEREQSLAAGCNDYLPKPVKVEELLKTVEKYLVSKN